MSAKDDLVVSVIATLAHGDETQAISYINIKVVGRGSFGVVYQTCLCETNEIVAVKKVLQDRRFKTRELQIMRSLDHQNIVKLKYFFYVMGDRKEDMYLNLVLEFVPETVYRVARRYARQKETIPMIFAKLYMYQLLRSLAYIHSKGICHRDIKPQNLLLDPSTGVLKLCDFGSAKVLIQGEPNVSYICSRYYRAPELIFGAVNYTCQIDVWSAGCVFAELLLGQPIFPGESGVDQLVEIIKVLGTPSHEQIRDMNPDYREFKFPQIKPHPWPKVFRTHTSPEAIQLVAKLLDYTASKRLRPLEACLHPFFDELRQEDATLPDKSPLPPLFNFNFEEKEANPEIIMKLIPAHLASQTSGADFSVEDGAGGCGRGSLSETTMTAVNAGTVAEETGARAMTQSSDIPLSVSEENVPPRSLRSSGRLSPEMQKRL